MFLSAEPCLRSVKWVSELIFKLIAPLFAPYCDALTGDASTRQ